MYYYDVCVCVCVCVCVSRSGCVRRVRVGEQTYLGWSIVTLTLAPKTVKARGKEEEEEEEIY
jgi:hypothetical protein